MEKIYELNSNMRMLIKYEMNSTYMTDAFRVIFGVFCLGVPFKP